MKLMQVKPGFTVTLPEKFWGNGERARAFAGAIIDVDAPGEDELLAGQMFKFEPAPEGSVPTESAIENPRVVQVLRAARAKLAAQQPAPAAHAAAPAPQAAEPAPEVKPKAGPAPRAPARSGGQPSLPTVDPLPNVPPAPAKA